MKTVETPARSESLRDRQKAATASLILEAARRCLEDSDLADLSFARIAAEAGIAERTIYRHFPTKEALIDAFWRAHQRAIRQGPYPDTAAGLIAAPPVVFPEFDRDAELVCAMVRSPQGRAIGMRANHARTGAFRGAVRDAAGDLPEPELTRLCAVVQTLYSAAAWLQMREMWGLTGEESGRAVSDAISVLLGAARGRPRKSELEERT